MIWYAAGSLLLFTILTCMFIRIPVAFAFLLTNIFGSLVFIGGFASIKQLVANSTLAVTTFSLVPVPLFILMGELFFHTNIAMRVFSTLDKIFGRLPGRLSYLTITGGSLFAALSGSSIANTAMLGSTLLPEMNRRHYAPVLSMGAIIATGGLAIMIPPSALTVLLGSIARIDIGRLLIAGVVPGIILAVGYMLLVTIVIIRTPEAAPQYEVESFSVVEKTILIVKNLLPMGIVIFMVVGLILLGVATPSEAAAFGVLGVLMVAALFRALTWHSIMLAVAGTMRVTGMVFLIILGATAFSQILAISGATSGLISWVTSLPLAKTWILIGMLAIVFLLGMLMESVSIIMLVVPIFFPLATNLGFDLIWFAILLLLMLEIGLATPPFGMGLFVLLGVSPKGVKFGEVAWAAVPYVATAIVVSGLLIAVPELVTWLPGQMGN